MTVNGEPGRGPMRVGLPVADMTAGFMLAHGIVCALLERERSGKGQRVHTSLLQANIRLMEFQAARYLLAGEVPGRRQPPPPLPRRPPRTKRGGGGFSSFRPAARPCFDACAMRSKRRS